ncbi:MAG: fibronectin type III domain-containing protein [Nitrospira sp.]|nr:fibronectin type III domain-containing protein [Nitrospira sp.]
MKILACRLCMIFSILLIPAWAGAGTASVSWNPNTESDLAGYKAYYGTSSGSYSSSPIDVGNVTTYTISGLTDNQTYYFVVTAYDTALNESAPSTEVSFLVGTATGGGGGGSNASSSVGGGGGCGIVRDISNRSGQSTGQISLNLALLGLLISLGKIKALIIKRSEKAFPAGLPA